MKVLVTCPPMLGLIDEFRAVFAAANVELLAPPVVQTLSEDELVGILPEQDGWIAEVLAEISRGISGVTAETCTCIPWRISRRQTPSMR